MNELKFIEEELAKLNKLKFAGFSGTFRDLNDFIENFNGLNSSYYSYDGNTRVSYTNTWRSVSDLYCHANYFFKVSFEEIIETFLNLKSKIVIAAICHDIGKCIIHFEDINNLPYYRDLTKKNLFMIKDSDYYGNGEISVLQNAIYNYIDGKIST